MELEHRFELPVGVDTAWETLTDISKVGPCFPGASLENVTGDDFDGSVKLKIGPITMNFKGTAKFVEKDPIAHRTRIEASGNAASSTAAMLVTATVASLSASRSAVDLITTLSITGRPAQFGRGVMVEVGNKLISQFADCVSHQLVGRDAGHFELVDVVNPDEVAAEVVGESEEPAGPTPVGVHRVPPRNEPIDLVQTAATPILKRVLPVVLGVVGLFLLRKLLARNKADVE